MKSAFPPCSPRPQIPVLASSPKESVRAMHFPFPLLSLPQLCSLTLTARQQALNEKASSEALPPHTHQS